MNIPSMFRFAKNVSKMSQHHYRMGAAIVKNGKPISVGVNQIKTHPNAPHSCLHAESHAIRCSGKYNLNGSSIFIYRETRKGEIANARPCVFCMEELKEKRFKNIYYTIKEFPYWKKEKIQ